MTDSPKKEVWYRFEDATYSQLASDMNGIRDDEHYIQTYIKRYDYPVIKHTPCGVWLDTGLGDRRWVSTQATKQFACSTIAGALESYKARKRKQRDIYQARANAAYKLLNYATLMSENPERFANEKSFYVSSRGPYAIR